MSLEGSLTCHGGPLAGSQQMPMTKSRIYWVVEGRLVANTIDLEWMDFEKARGAYIRFTSTVNRRAHDALMWRSFAALKESTDVGTLSSAGAGSPR